MKKDSVNYLITGAGGREHALAWKLSQSSKVNRIYCMPGNAGTASTQKCINIPSKTIEALLEWSIHMQIDQVLVGSEDLLVQGIVDVFQDAGLQVIGPHQEAAQLEGSKSFAKSFMKRNNIPTPEYTTFNDLDLAITFLDQAHYPLVIKADGLAAGKGVLICQNKNEAQDAVYTIMKDRKFGSAGDNIVVEQYLFGFETSIIALYDGKTIVPLLSAKDHKKIFDGELGKNTGGMGMLVPNPYFEKRHNSDFIENILLPTQRGLDKEALNFCGVIFFGLMIQDEKCYLLEYNTRFGDPEIQTILMLMQSDLHSHLSCMLTGKLSSEVITWKEGVACCVVLASGGYPDKYEIAKPLVFDSGIQSQVFVAGAILQDNTWVTNGGRVLNVIATGKQFDIARAQVYKDINCINFEGKYCRSDIGLLSV